VNGPGAALWVEADPVAQPPATEPERSTARGLRTLIISILRKVATRLAAGTSTAPVE